MSEPIDYIQRTKDQYDALGYPSYRWVHNEDPPPFTPLAKPLAESRVALIASGGIYQLGQTAFHFKDDTSFRAIDVETPAEFQGAVMGLLNQRRGIIVGSQEEGPMCVVEARVPLAEMFGFSTVLTSSTPGKAQFTMEPGTYKQVPAYIAEELAKKAAEAKKNTA